MLSRILISPRLQQQRLAILPRRTRLRSSQLKSERKCRLRTCTGSNNNNSSSSTSKPQQRSSSNNKFEQQLATSLSRAWCTFQFVALLLIKASRYPEGTWLTKPFRARLRLDLQSD